MTIGRTRTVAVAVAALALTGSMAAAYATVGRSDADTITACVDKRTGEMRLETRREPCRIDEAPREREVTWNEEGPQGLPGEPGADGTSFRSGNGVPAPGLGGDGDSYVDVANGNIYTKTGGTWTMTGNVRGPAGRDGVGTVFLGSGLATIGTDASGAANGWASTPPSGNGVGGAVVVGDHLDGWYLANVQLIPAGKLSEYSAWFKLPILPGNFPAVDVRVTSQLYAGSANGSTLTLVPGASCTVTFASPLVNQQVGRCSSPATVTVPADQLGVIVTSWDIVGGTPEAIQQGLRTATSFRMD